MGAIIFAAVAWLGIALYTIHKEVKAKKPTRKYLGCCQNCGCRRCTYHPMCWRCEEETEQPPLPLEPPPPSEDPYR